MLIRPHQTSVSDYSLTSHRQHHRGSLIRRLVSAAALHLAGDAVCSHREKENSGTISGLSLRTPHRWTLAHRMMLHAFLPEAMRAPYARTICLADFDPSKSPRMTPTKNSSKSSSRWNTRDTLYNHKIERASRLTRINIDLETRSMEKRKTGWRGIPKRVNQMIYSKSVIVINIRLEMYIAL